MFHNEIEIAINAKLRCNPCRRESYRWWLPFNLTKCGIYHILCMGCENQLFFVRIVQGVLEVFDSHGRAVSFKQRPKI